jgi:hypothetical protein
MEDEEFKLKVVKCLAKIETKQEVLEDLIKGHISKHWRVTLLVLASVFGIVVKFLIF